MKNIGFFNENCSISTEDLKECLAVGKYIIEIASTLLQQA